MTLRIAKISIFGPLQSVPNRHGSLSFVSRGVIPLFLGLALVNGLTASPLLVNCIPADGRSLVELVGQDPCHHQHQETSVNNGDREDVVPGDLADPCIDLTLDNVGTAQQGAVLESPLILTSTLLAAAVPAPPLICQLPGVGVPLKKARDPLPCLAPGARLFSALRI